MISGGELIFEWDDANTGHIARHDATRSEVEQVFGNDPLDLAAEVADGEERYTGVGHTDRLRVLVVVWTMRGEATAQLRRSTQASPSRNDT